MKKQQAQRHRQARQIHALKMRKAKANPKTRLKTAIERNALYTARYYLTLAQQHGIANTKVLLQAEINKLN